MPFYHEALSFLKRQGDKLHVRTGINDLTSHDLRHGAISRVFNSGMKIFEVMAVNLNEVASQLSLFV